MNGPVRVALVDDYEVVVHGLAAMLAPHARRVEVVDMAAGSPHHRPVDVALFDVFGSGEVHTGAVRRLLDGPGRPRVAVFTSNFDPELVETATRWGLHGYLSKSLTGDRLADAVVRIAEGEVVVEPGESRGGDPRRRWPGKAHDLSEREAEVLALITQGLDNEAIAERLYISPNTLKTRIRHLYRRKGFDNRVQAAVWGMRHGFEPPDGDGQGS